MSKFTHGVRTTTAPANNWVQTGFTPEQASAEAARLNAAAALPGVAYTAARVRTLTPVVFLGVTEYHDHGTAGDQARNCCFCN